MTATERLQADWPKWEIGVRHVDDLGWTWRARVRWENGALLIAAAHNGALWHYVTENAACQSCRCALKAIRKAVT